MTRTFVVLALSLFVPFPAATMPSPPQSKRIPDQQEFQHYADQAVQAQRQGQSEEAIRLYLKALQLKPGWGDGWRNVGMLFADLKDFKRAEAAFKNVLEVDPKNGAAWALLGLSEYQEGRYDQAYKDIERGRALGVGGEDLDNVATYHSALMMIQKGDFEVAHHLLVHVARAGVDDADLVTALGLAALRIAANPERVDAKQKDLAARVGQIELQAVHGKVSVVTAAYQKLIQELPETRGLHYALGSFLVSSGEYDQGIEEMQRELQLNPADAMAMLQIAMADLKTGQPQQGLPYAQNAVELAPKLFAAHYALGWILYRMGQNDQAIAELEQVVKLAPDSAQGHYALAEAYARAHRKADSEKERAAFARLKQEGLQLQPTPANRPLLSHEGARLPSSQ